MDQLDLNQLQQWAHEPMFWLSVLAAIMAWRLLRSPKVEVYVSPPSPPADKPAPSTMERINEATKVAQQISGGAQKLWEWRWLILHRIGYRLVVHGQHSRFPLYHKGALRLIGEQNTRTVREQDIFTTDEWGDEQHSHAEWKSILHSQWTRFEDVWLHLDYTPARPPSKDEGGKGSQREEISFYFLTSNREILQRFRAYCDSLDDEGQNKTLTVYYPRWSSWTAATTRKLRPGDSLFFNDDVHLQILEDYQQFLQRRDEYHNRGRLHKRGYLLRGAPGGGKTNLALWFAGEVGMNLAVLSMRGLDDESFTSLTLNMPPRTILLLEDIDTVAPASREKDKGTDKDKKDDTDKEDKSDSEDKSSLSLGALLNTLDGLLSREGQVVFMTTNHPEKLDGALVRPGRADVVRTIEAPNGDTTARMARSWYGAQTDTDALVKKLQTLSPVPSAAELEAHFDRNDEMVKALHNVEDITKAR